MLPSRFIPWEWLHVEWEDSKALSVEASAKDTADKEAAAAAADAGGPASPSKVAAGLLGGSVGYVNPWEVVVLSE